MEAETIIRIVGYFTAGIVFIVGMVIILGFFPSTIPDNVRIAFGCVLVVYGAYRSLMLWWKRRNSRKTDEELS